MANKNKKEARFKSEPSLRKNAKASHSPDDWVKQQPTWRVSSMRLADPYGWHTMTRADMMSVLNILRNLESMTWTEIMVTNKYRYHHVKTNDICREARECLDADWQGGTDEVFSVRLNAVSRVWGIIAQGVFYLLWFDPQHAICPSTYMDINS